MANLDAPNGLKPVRHLTGGVIRTEEFKIASGSSTAIFTGDCVKLLGTGYIDECDAGDRILGVFAGCSYANSSGEQVFSRQWTASATTQGSVDVTALIQSYFDKNVTLGTQQILGLRDMIAVIQEQERQHWLENNPNTTLPVLVLSEAVIVQKKKRTMIATFIGACCVRYYINLYFLVPVVQ